MSIPGRCPRIRPAANPSKALVQIVQARDMLLARQEAAQPLVQQVMPDGALDGGTLGAFLAHQVHVVEVDESARQVGVIGACVSGREHIALALDNLDRNPRRKLTDRLLGYLRNRCL